MKDFTVTLKVEAENKDLVESMLDKIASFPKVNIWDDEIVDDDEPVFEGRIRYVEDFMDFGECYLFENRWSNEDSWGLEIAVPFHELNGEKVLIPYQALTQIREWQRLGMRFHFE